MTARARYDDIADDLAASDPSIELGQMMGMPCIKAGGKMIIGYESSGEMVFKLPNPRSTRKLSRSTAPSSSTPPAKDGPSRSGCRCRPLTRASGQA